MSFKTDLDLFLMSTQIFAYFYKLFKTVVPAKLNRQFLENRFLLTFTIFPNSVWAENNTRQHPHVVFSTISGCLGDSTLSGGQ